MKIKIGTKEVIPQWIELAREVEPIFQGSMADNEDFKSFMKNKIEKREAIVAIDENNSNELMGLITISHNKNSISWFAVFEIYRNQGVGSVLLEYGLNELNDKKEISVITFDENYIKGFASRRIYEKFGFEDYESIIEHGHPRTLMKRLPEK